MKEVIAQKDIVIVGAGGFAREVAWLIEYINSINAIWNMLGFVEKDKDLVGKKIGKYKVFMGEDDLIFHNQNLYCVIAIGNPEILLRVTRRLSMNNNLIFPNIIHPSVDWDADRIHIGKGNIICAGNILTTGITLGDFNILNLASTIGHDAVIGNCNVINPGVNLSGSIMIADGCLIGTGSVILENIHIGSGAKVGGGAVVTKDINENTIVVGVPAKPLIR